MTSIDIPDAELQHVPSLDDHEQVDVQALPPPQEFMCSLQQSSMGRHIHILLVGT